MAEPETRSTKPEAQLRFRTVLYTTLEAVRIATLLRQPVMPESTSKLLDLAHLPNR
jgi:methionyl-tRNA synthetase